MQAPSLGQHLKSFLKPGDIPNFQYLKKDLALDVTEACFRPGGYCNVVIAEGDWDQCPIKYYFRFSFLDQHGGTGAVTEGADNGETRNVQVHRHPATVQGKLVALLNEPHFHYVEYMNKADSREYEKVYSWQLLD